ncbi:MAG TPA: D-alanyl-D-alanine carboxypeptidase [Clostridiales bacterium]|nr:D-alanyl-D-alanine carboxypeptidase [Clostridiales bacterium]
MHNYKQRLNNSFLICIGLLILFVTVNFLSLRNYYDEMFNPYYFVNNDFEEKLKKENSSIDKSYENENSTVPENEDPKRIKLNSLAALLMDAENNRVLYEVNGYQEMPMASTTKIMTCIIALENGNMEDVVTVSSYAAGMPDVQLNIRAGEQYYLKDLMYSLMLESHNDSAVAIAEHIGGTVEGFATMMNDKARALGCYDTNFITPNGLDAEGHYTTARDLAVISSYAIQNKEFIDITNTSSYQFKELKKGRSFIVSNKNKFLYMMDGAIGIKTGFTGKAGYCFVGALKKPDRTLISVVLGCGWPPRKNLKWTDTIRLMTYGIENYEKKQIFENRKLEPVYVDNGQTSHIGLAVNGDLNLLIRNDEKVSVEYIVPDILSAPVKKGKVVGSARYFIDNNLYTELPIYTTDDSKKIDYKFCFMRILRLWGLQY